MRLSVNVRFISRILLVASVLSALAACGDNSVERTGSSQISDSGGDAGEESKGAPERFDATAADADSEGPYAVSGAIDFKYAAISSTQNVDGSSGERVSTFDDLIDVLGVMHYPLVSADTPAPMAGFPIILFHVDLHLGTNDRPH